MTHPERLGRYRVDGVLGQGAMGTVYKGFDPGVARTVAIKTVRRDLLADTPAWDAAARFRREAQAAGRLSHPHIVTVHDFGEDAQCAWLVCEYVEGQPLDRWLSAHGQPTLEQALQWMAQLLDALACAHAQGVVHRDVKGANLLVTPARSLKLTDFGIAQLDTSDLTQAGLMLGTPSCMAPEQIRQEALDGRADLFAAGVLLYTLLTGRKPFAGAGAEQVMHQVLAVEPVPPCTIDPRLPPGLDAITARALAKAPDDRFANAQAFLVALHDAARQAGAALPATAFAAVNAVACVPTADATVLAPRRARWSQADLDRIETCLREHLGPVARLLVQRTAAQADSVDDLGTRLAQRIPEPASRARFLADVGASERRTAFTNVRTTASAPALALDDPSIARVQNALTLLIGPMASIAMRRALRDAHTLPGLVEQAAAHVPDAQARRRFLGEFGLAAAPDRTGAGDGPWKTTRSRRDTGESGPP